MIGAVLALAVLWPRAARAVEPFAGDKRLECEYAELSRKRIPLIGQLTEPNSDPCAKLAWTGEGELLWKDYRSDLDRHDGCGRELWQRRLALAGGGAVASVVAVWTAMQISGSGTSRQSTILPLTALGGGVVAGVIAWLTERPCPVMRSPEWAR